MADAAKTATASPTADVTRYRRMFEEAQTVTTSARAESVTDLDLYDGAHLTAGEKAVLRARKQPDNVFNMTRLAVNGTLGVIKQGATDPRAYPRNPQDEDSADVASKTLRYIGDKNNFTALKVDCAKDFLVPGSCAAIVETDQDGQVTISQIRWEEFFYDPHSRRQDFKDARYMGAARWLYADDLASMYPDKKPEITRTSTDGGMAIVDLSFSDRPEGALGSIGWCDPKKRRLLVIELYHQEGGTWRRCVYHGGGLLEEGPSPYEDDKGKPCNPIEAQSCYVDRHNDRFGTVRDMRGPQNEINKRHQKLLHILNSRQLQESGPGMGIGDAETARREAGKPDGVIPSGWQIVQTSDMARGQAELLQEAKAFLERFAPNPAMLGRQDAGQSGRKALVDQQAGLTELAVVFGGIEEWELRIYRQAWNRARQFWKAPTWVRITDDEGAPEFVGINQPEYEMEPVIDPMTGQPAVDPRSGEPAQKPKLYPTIQPGGGVEHQPRVLGYRNKLAELDVDIVIDTVPDTATIQQEQFASLAELAKLYGPGEVPFDDMLELSVIPQKRQMLEKRKARREEMAQNQPPPNPVIEAKARNLDADTEVKLSTAFRNVHQAGAHRAAAAASVAQPPQPPMPALPAPQQMPPAPPPIQQAQPGF
jgi:hypothetical protein